MRYFLLFFALVVVATVSIAGFRGSKSRKPPLYIFPDMERQTKVKPQKFNAFFSDNLGSRDPVPGAISQMRPFRVGDQEVYPYEDVPANTGRIAGTTNFLETNPFPVTAELLARGQRQLNIICAACHTEVGDGNSVAKKIAAMPTIANLHDKRIVELPDGEIFNTIGYGKSTMMGYATVLDVPDRWAIVAYLRALQLSWLGTPDDVPESARASLEKK